MPPVHVSVPFQSMRIITKAEVPLCMQVADFNLSRAFEEDMIPSSGNINSPQWAAPERLSGQPFYNGMKADVFR